MSRATKTLAVWMNGERVGDWHDAERDQQSFRYDPNWLDSAAARPLSLSLPFLPDNAPHRGPAVYNYFDNLLPDSKPIRDRIASRYRTESRDAFALLREIGADCVGAVQLLREDEQPEHLRHIRGQPLTVDDVADLLAGVPTTAGWHPTGREDGLRISIAGAQEKTALLWHEGRWQLPMGATPTTHLFKLPLGRIATLGVDLSTSVENEWLCSRLLAAYGLPIANCEMARFGESPVLIVERFDRRLSGDQQWWLRLPQEDYCQALALPPERTYESDKGPGLPEIMRVLQGSKPEHRELDRERFFRAQILFWMLAAIDGHAKNFSLFIEAGGAYRATPLYDVLSAWPFVGSGAGRMPRRKLKMAMAVHGKSKHYDHDTIQRRHWTSTARKCGFGADIEAMIDRLIEQTPGAIARVEAELPSSFPQSVAQQVFDGLRLSAEKLAMQQGRPH